MHQNRIPQNLTGSASEPEIHEVALKNATDTFLFRYTEITRSELLRTLGRLASNPEIAFSWYDAAVLSGRIREYKQ